MYDTLKGLPPHILVLINDLKADRAVLNQHEAAWRDKQAFLESKGYMLRDRYHPQWVPPWTEPENEYVDPERFESYIPLPVRSVSCQDVVD